MADLAATTHFSSHILLATYGV